MQLRNFTKLTGPLMNMLTDVNEKKMNHEYFSKKRED